MINFEELKIKSSTNLQADKWNGLMERLKLEVPPNISDQKLTVTNESKRTDFHIAADDSGDGAGKLGNAALSIKVKGGSRNLDNQLMAINEWGDLILSARTNPKNDPKKSLCRAMVDAGDLLSINYKGDFKRGVQVWGSLIVSGKGGHNVDFEVNGRLRSNHKGGGLWVQSDRFVGGGQTSSIGFFNNKAWRLVVTKDGNVGIGTTKPRHRLSLGKGLAQTKFAIHQNDNGTSTYGMGVASGKFLFNVGNPKAKYVFLNKPGSSAKEICIIEGDGDIRARNYLRTSDKRLKKDIRPFNQGLKIIEKMNPVSYKYNGLGDMVGGSKEIGFIAQDLEEIAPYLVTKKMGKLNPTELKETELLSIYPLKVIYILVNAVKELSQQIKALEMKV